MRKMTEQEAEHYILSGYFPEGRGEDLEGQIVDLQDVFGHQRYYAILKWLYKEETSKNAEKLFRLIWNAADVEQYLSKVTEVKALEIKEAELENKIYELKQELGEVQTELGSTFKSFYYEEI